MLNVLIISNLLTTMTVTVKDLIKTRVKAIFFRNSIIERTSVVNSRKNINK